MPRIVVNPDELRAAAQQLQAAGRMLEGQIHSLRGAWSRLDRGALEVSARGTLEGGYERSRARSTDLAEAAGIMVRELERAALAFEAADREGLERLAATVGLYLSDRPRIPLWALASAAVLPALQPIVALGWLAGATRGPETGTGLHWVPIPTDYETVWTDARRWSSLTLDEKVAILQEEHYRVAQENGITPVRVYVEDLRDPAYGDLWGSRRASRGILGEILFHERGREHIVLDLDNINSSHPEDILDTVAHETRHVTQAYYVAHPDQRPDSISLDQINGWRRNFANYYSGSDMGRYESQPVEQDARDFALGYLLRIKGQTER
jgi:uncharacterized protein YukE